MKFEDLEKARKILKLNKEVTLDEVKSAFRKLAKDSHPDVAEGVNREQAIERFREISWAYEIIVSYISGYKFSFSKDDFSRRHTDISKEIKDHIDRFYDGWL
ncbi:MAG: DnaJ domain-containing protein [Candidatus Omnitrophica bacterium]|nr:DnaJ domain-containing protein [Candidatus Omnitrophota bacterium]